VSVQCCLAVSTPRCVDLRISVFGGPTPSIGALLLHARLRASPAGSSADPPEYLVLCRDGSSGPASGVVRSEVTDQEVLRLVRLLEAAGMPGRTPRVTPNASLLGAGPYVALEARVQGRVASLNLVLENAGFSGEDAEPLRAVLRRLAELAPPGGRAAVRAVMERLAVDRRLVAGPVRARDGTDPRDRVGLRPPGEDADRGTERALPRGSLAAR
jgi:hypothetical protein